MTEFRKPHTNRGYTQMQCLCNLEKSVAQCVHVYVDYVGNIN